MTASHRRNIDTDMLERTAVGWVIYGPVAFLIALGGLAILTDASPGRAVAFATVGTLVTLGIHAIRRRRFAKRDG